MLSQQADLGEDWSKVVEVPFDDSRVDFRVAYGGSLAAFFPPSAGGGFDFVAEEDEGHVTLCH